MDKKLVLSKMMLQLEIENAVAKALKEYVEGSFATQFPGGEVIILSPVNISFSGRGPFDSLNIRLAECDIEWVE